MPTFSPSDGVNEREPTLISDAALQDCDGAEYRVGQPGIFCARGRQLVGTVAALTGTGLYEAGFDSSPGYLIAHVGNTLSAALISPAFSFGAFDSLPSGSSAIVGCHYANRHYLATNVANRRLESGITAFPIGMSRSTFSVAASVSGSTGSMSATTGLVYWVTEYDSVRGIESVTGASTNTGVFSGKASVTVTVTGVSANPRADKIRWYRSVDGGGYPDGGLVQETAIGTTSFTDTLATTTSLSVPEYGVVSIGGLDNDRDEAPPALSLIFGPFLDSLLGVDPTEPRVLRFTPAGYPDSWPSSYGIPLDTHRRDEIVTGIVMPGRAGIFCNDSVHAIFRLPRDSDSIFAAGEMQQPVTDERGCMSRRGATSFTPPGSGPLAAWVARDGIWASTLVSSPFPLTDRVDWESRVDVQNLRTCRLVNDPMNRRLVFIYRRASDSTYNTGIWYLDYQEFQRIGIRITFADHGPLVDGVTIAASDGRRRLATLDARANNGQVYLESNQDADDSRFLNSSGAVRFRIRTKEFLPAGPTSVLSLGMATWMHDAGPPRIEHRLYFDRRDANPEIKNFQDPTIRNAEDVQIGPRQVNSLSLEIESAGTVSYGVHWIDIEAEDTSSLGGRKGA